MLKTVLTTLVVYFLVGPLCMYAQSAISIRGAVADSAGKPIDGAVVALFSAGSNSLVRTLFSTAEGKYEFLVKAGDTFFLQISAKGFKSHKSAPLVLLAGDSLMDLLPVRLLAESAKELTSAKAVTKSQFVERKADKIIVNPDALLSSAGSSALEVLEKSPGVQVDLNGNISLKGKQGVLIYIDDRQTYLSAADLAAYLKSLPASSVQVIEIMTNPPARYDAAGNAGIINIRLKKSKTKGLNGGLSASAGQGRYSRTNNSFNINYRINKVNYFMNAGYTISNSFQDLMIWRRYYQQNGALNSVFTQNSYLRMHHNNLTSKMGLDYYINQKSTLGFVFNGFDNHSFTSAANYAELRNAKEEVEQVVKASSPLKRKFRNGSANINYELKLDSVGRNFSLNLDYLTFDSKIEQNLLSRTYLPDQTFVSGSNLVSNLPATIDIGTAKADYTHPLHSNGRLETGFKGSLINTNNMANFYDENNGVLTVNNDFSNNFRYRESIMAAYASYNKERSRYSFQSGLRYEHTTVLGHQLGNPVRNDSSFSRNYSGVFPTLFALYNLDSAGRHQVILSYGRRIERPNYQDMNPFTYPLDRFTLYAGNPYLQPTYTNGLELSHVYRNKVTTTLSYSSTRNVISETIEQKSNIFYSRPGNIGRQISYGISINAELNIKDWWSLQLYSELMNNTFTSLLYGQSLSNSGKYWYVGPVNQFKINKTWSAELAGNYQTRIVTGQFVMIQVGSVRGAVARKILKNSGTLRFSVNDIFYTHQPGGDIKSLNNSSASWHSYLDTRVYTLALSYKFNKGKSLNSRRSGGSENERNRVS